MINPSAERRSKSRAPGYVIALLAAPLSRLELCQVLKAPEPPRLSLETLLSFEREGHVATRGLFESSEFKSIAETLRAIAAEEERAAARHAAKVMKDQGLDSDPPPFLQAFNPHRRHAAARQLALSPILAGTAAALLGASCVRLYQDALFWKRPGHDATAWHADLWTAPLATNSHVTVWIPLQMVTEDLSPLVFRSGTHRDLASREHEDVLEDLGIDPYDVPSPGEFGDHHAPLNLGDATWHHGWVIHGAPPLGQNAPPEGRLAYTASYFADGALALPAAEEPEDVPSFQAWIDEVEPGYPLEHPLLPIAFGTPQDEN